MSEKTKINIEVHDNSNNSVTVINNDLIINDDNGISMQDSSSTVINTEAINDNVTKINEDIKFDENSIDIDTVICNSYKIKEKLDVATGEADLYICQKDDVDYICKVYRRKTGTKPKVEEALKNIDSIYIAKVYDTGTYNDYPFEILPYYKNGSLEGMKFTIEELEETIIPCINKGLKILHDAGIIHKDLKPSNIMLSDDKKSVAIIDFGISSIKDRDNTILVTKTGMTPEYSAPETFRNLFLEESDYYSFGVTIYELYCGYSPYKNMDTEEIARYTAVQRFPIPTDMPERLKKFILATTYYDITNRNNKDNPNRRWTYEDVKRWCMKIDVVMPGEGIAAKLEHIPDYEFCNEKYNDIKKLVEALGVNWEEGKKNVFRGYLSAYFQNVDPMLAAYAIEVEERSILESGKDDILYFELLYKLDHDLKSIYWKGRTFESLSGLGREILESLWKNKDKDNKYYDTILAERMLSSYIKLAVPSNTLLKDTVDGIENLYKLNKDKERERVKCYYLIGYLLSGQKLFVIDGQKFRSVGELVTYLKGTLVKSNELFEKFSYRMVNFDNELDVQLESWLISLGKSAELDLWRNELLK